MLRIFLYRTKCGRPLVEAGTVSHEQAMDKAKSEYKKSGKNALQSKTSIS